MSGPLVPENQPNTSRCRQPVEAKTTPTIPPLIVISTAPFSLYPRSSSQYLVALREFTLHILTISLLPNRLPISSVSYLSGHLPFAALALLDISELILSLVPVPTGSYTFARKPARFRSRSFTKCNSADSLDVSHVPYLPDGLSTCWQSRTFGIEQ